MSSRRSAPFFVLITFAGCFLIAWLLIPYIAGQISYFSTRAAEQAKMEIALELLEKYPKVENMVPWVVKRIGPTVVGIRTLVRSPTGRGYITAESEGSGVIVDPQGYILTNYHVVRDAAAYELRLSDGREFSDVKLVGYDTDTDIAVLKIAEPNLTAIAWGDSDEVEVGETVLAIGSPFGFTHSVTQGIVSAKERYTTDQPRGMEFLQTDVAVNPGSSGGPLVDMAGKLIGINTAIIGDSFRGISLAIPSVLAKKVYDDIRSYGAVQHGWVGIGMEPLFQNYAKSVGLTAKSGIVVTRVLAGSPADKAGLKKNDVIVSWDGEPIIEPTKLSHLILMTNPGETVTCGVIRNRNLLEITIEVSLRPVQLRK